MHIHHGRGFIFVWHVIDSCLHGKLFENLLFFHGNGYDLSLILSSKILIYIYCRRPIFYLSQMNRKIGMVAKYSFEKQLLQLEK